MIISEHVDVKINPSNKNHFKSFGYDINQKIITVPISHLSVGSHTEISIKCDICNCEKLVEYRYYLSKIKIGGYYVCSNCKNVKIKNTCEKLYGDRNYNNREKCKKTNLKRYGFENPFEREDVKDKIKKENLEKYGVEFISQSKQIQEKIKLTNLKKYGFEWALSNKDVIEKRNKTNLEKYGCEIVSNNKDVKNKIKQTNLEKYGTEYPLESSLIINKIKQTNLKKYGFENPFEREDVKDKIKQTNLKKYGCENPNQNIEIRNKIKQTNLDRYGYENPLQNSNVYNKMIKSSFIIKKYKDSELNYQASYELDFLNKYFKKLKIENCISIKYELNNIKKVYYPDFYLPDYNLIVEIKSSMWYYKHIERNLAKQKQCLNNGYNFIFIINKNYNEFEKILNFPFGD